MGKSSTPKGDLSQDEEGEEEDLEVTPGMVKAGRDKDGNAMFDLNQRKKVFVKQFKG